MALQGVVGFSAGHLGAEGPTQGIKSFQVNA